VAGGDLAGGKSTAADLGAWLVFEDESGQGRVHAGRRSRGDQRKGFTETDYARLLDAAHQQLGGPLVVVWDNLKCAARRCLTWWR
jgi:hypothetical protein